MAARQIHADAVAGQCAADAEADAVGTEETISHLVADGGAAVAPAVRSEAFFKGKSQSVCCQVDKDEMCFLALPCRFHRTIDAQQQCTHTQQKECGTQQGKENAKKFTFGNDESEIVLGELYNGSLNSFNVREGAIALASEDGGPVTNAMRFKL